MKEEAYNKGQTTIKETAKRCRKKSYKTKNEIRNVSPLLASRTGLDTSEDSMEVVAKKIAELVEI